MLKNKDEENYFLSSKTSRAWYEFTSGVFLTLLR